MNPAEMSAWRAFTNVVKFFLGRTKVPTLLTSLHQLSANMSIKLHFLHSHLSRFPENLGDLTDEQGERFHQDISDMEVRYQGRWDATMLANTAGLSSTMMQELPILVISKTLIYG